MIFFFNIQFAVVLIKNWSTILILKRCSSKRNAYILRLKHLKNVHLSVCLFEAMIVNNTKCVKVKQGHIHNSISGVRVGKFNLLLECFRNVGLTDRRTNRLTDRQSDL